MFEMMTRMELFDAQAGFYQSELEIAQQNFDSLG